MNIYLASAITNKLFMQALEAYIINFIPATFVSKWYKEEKSTEYLQERHNKDIINGVDKADVVLVFYPYGETGTLCELAYAVGKGIPVIYVRMQMFDYDDPLIVGDFNYVTSMSNFPSVLVLRQIKLIATSLIEMIDGIILISETRK